MLLLTGKLNEKATKVHFVFKRYPTHINLRTHQCYNTVRIKKKYSKIEIIGLKKSLNTIQPLLTLSLTLKNIRHIHVYKIHTQVKMYDII